MKKNKTNQYLLVAGMTAASLVSGCDKTEKEWAKSPGTKGFINLDAIKQAFQSNPSVEDFEKRVNEIFEGDNLVIFETKEISKGFKSAAKEDLDNNKEISDGDEILFILTVADGTATLRGMGVNSYYKESWSYRPNEKKQTYTRTHYHRPYFHYWYWGRSWGGYYTSRDLYSRTSGHRDSYRKGSAFVSQVNNNVGFENRMSKKYGTGFRKSVDNVSSTRKSYINTTKKSSGFKSMLSKNKSSSLRSKSSTKSSFSSSKSSSRSSGRSGGRSGGFRGSSGFGV